MPTHRRPLGPGPGRPKGVKPKNKQAVLDRCQALGCDPIAGLILVAQEIRAAKRRSCSQLKLEAWCYAELAQYCYPKLKAVEHSGAVQVDLPRAVVQGPPPPPET